MTNTTASSFIYCLKINVFRVGPHSWLSKFFLTNHTSSHDSNYSLCATSDPLARPLPPHHIAKTTPTLQALETCPKLDLTTSPINCHIPYFSYFGLYTAVQSVMKLKTSIVLESFLSLRDNNQSFTKPNFFCFLDIPFIHSETTCLWRTYSMPKMLPWSCLSALCFNSTVPAQIKAFTTTYFDL